MVTNEQIAGGLGWYGVNCGLYLMTDFGSEVLGQAGNVPAAAAQPESVNLVLGLVQAFILGIVQGLTEFLPISSTAHLQVFTKALGWATVGAKPFVATIQFGSVVAVIIYFWKDITQILTGGWQAIRQRDWQQEEPQLLVGIAVGTLPILVGGFLLKNALNDNNSAINSMTTIAIASIVMALLLGAAEKLGSRKRNFKHLTIWDGLLMGLGQMLSLAPGVSRSGSTITTGLFLGLERQTAARFSFLLGIPALTIATLYQFFKEALGKIDLALVVVGTLSAFVFSYLSIAWLLRYLQTQNNWIFVWYRLAFAAAILSAIATGVLKNS
jgi:undecaprenyl-diphosphatase